MVKITTQGAVTAMLTGTISSSVLIILSPTVWVDVFGFPTAINTWLKNPAIVSFPLAFLMGIVVSLKTRSAQSEAGFEREKLRTLLGVGAEK